MISTRISWVNKQSLNGLSHNGLWGDTTQIRSRLGCLLIDTEWAVQYNWHKSKIILMKISLRGRQTFGGSSEMLRGDFISHDPLIIMIVCS